MGPPADTAAARPAASTATAADESTDLESAWRLAYIATGDQAMATDATTRAFAQVAAQNASHGASRPELLHVTLAHSIRAAAERPNAAPDEVKGSAVTTAMWQLPPNQRAALWLTQVEELDDEDLGHVLGLSPANAEHVAQRATGWLDVALDHGSGPLCEYESQLPDFLHGKLPMVEAAEIDNHLSGCPTCLSKVNAYEELTDLPVLLRRAAPKPPANLTIAARGRQPAENPPVYAGAGAGGSGSPPAVRPLAVCCAALLALGVLGASILQPARSSKDPVTTIDSPSSVTPTSTAGGAGGGPTNTAGPTSSVQITTTTTVQPAVTFPTLPHR